MDKTTFLLLFGVLLFFYQCTNSTSNQSESKIDKLIEKDSIFSSFDGTKIFYQDEGNGAPILLIHGFINTGKSWNKSVLKKALLDKGYRVISPDLRGNGQSDKPQNKEVYTDDAEIKDLIGLMDKLKIKTYTAIGYSRGSIVLAKLLTHETRIHSAVLGGMGLDFTNPNWDRRILFADAFSGNVALTNETEGAVNYAKSIGADLKALHFQQVYQPVTSIDAIQQIKAKTLIIAGDADSDNGSPKDLHNHFSNSQLVIVKGDHNNTYKQANFSDAVMDFIK